MAHPSKPTIIKKVQNILRSIKPAYLSPNALFPTCSPNNLAKFHLRITFVPVEVVPKKNGHNFNGHKECTIIKLLIQIRKKTGLSQYEMAEYLDVPRSQVNMAEKGLRKLPTSAVLKLADIEKIISGSEKSKGSMPAIEDDKTPKKLKDHHKQKMEDHLFKAKQLQRRLKKLLLSHKQSHTKLKMIDGLSKNDSQNKNKDDVQWSKYHDHLSRKGLLKNQLLIQKLTIDIEVHLGYAAVHEKILGKLS